MDSDAASAEAPREVCERALAHVMEGGGAPGVPVPACRDALAALAYRC